MRPKNAGTVVRGRPGVAAVTVERGEGVYTAVRLKTVGRERGYTFVAGVLR